MNPDYHRQGKGLVPALELVVEGPQVPPDGHEDAELALSGQHHADVARVLEPRIGVQSDDDARREIGGGVDVVMGQKGNFGQVHLVSDQDHLVDRRFGRLDRGQGVHLPLQEPLRQVFGRRIERQPQKPPRGVDVEYDGGVPAIDDFED